MPFITVIVNIPDKMKGGDRAQRLCCVAYDGQPNHKEWE